MEFLRQQAADLRLFWREELRRFVPASAVILMLSAAIGAGAVLLAPELGEQVIQGFRQLVAEAGMAEADGSLSFLGILRNNWRAMLFITCYGLLPFLYLPAVALFSNGALIGVVLGYYHTHALPLTVALAALIPHGIFEIPALVIAGAMGLCLCHTVSRRILRPGSGLSWRALAEGLLQALLLLLFPLLLLAAAVETWGTPLVVSLFI